MPDGWQSHVTSAWNSKKDEFAEKISAAVTGKSLSNHSFTARFAVCSSFNIGNRDRSSYWGDDGDGTLNLTSVTVSAFAGVKAGDSEISGLQVKLPLPFALLQATGRYNYSQPCALWSMGKRVERSSAGGTGTMDAKAENGTLRYLIQVIDPEGDLKLQLTGATVDGTRSSNVKPTGTPDNAVLAWLVDFFGRGLQERRSIEAALESFFGNGEFGRDMVAELNKIIHQQRAREGATS